MSLADREYVMDPYTDEELVEALDAASKGESDTNINWTGDDGIMKRAADRIRELTDET